MSETIQIVKAEYAQSGESTSTDNMGMREMQKRAYEARNAQYLLIKAPPAAGKSRALMFLGLDKIYKQGLKKVIVVVPERAIGASFDNIELTKFGFWEDWKVETENNLCIPTSEKSLVKVFERFMENDDKILICTHATLRFAYENISDGFFDNVLLAIDEFHHISQSVDSRLGEVLRSIMSNTTAHIIAMTGSYFRGDAIPVLSTDDEAKFTKVTYNYYEQLNGYEHLKSLGIGYHFYQGRYLSAINEVLDTNRKTILHIPNVNSGESTKQKHDEVGAIIDLIGDGSQAVQDSKTGVISIPRFGDGKIIKIADLVEDDQPKRDKIVAYLRAMTDEDDLDLIIALGMAKEGFDWPYCEHALTVGYRSSLTEIIQIIGRCTRDSPNKEHAQFTNLIAEPDAQDSEVKTSVNNMLKAITASLLMEQVLAPNFKFKTKLNDEDKAQAGEILIKGFKEARSQRVTQILETDLNDLKAKCFQDPDILKAMPGGVDPLVLNKVLIPKVIRKNYPDLSDEQVEEVRQGIVADAVIKNSSIEISGDKKFVRMAGQFVNIDDLNIDLIDSVNPFQKAFEILSKSVTPKVLRVIQDTIDSNRLDVTEEEALIAYPKIKLWLNAHNGQEPSRHSNNFEERRMANVILFLKNEKKKRG